MRHRLVATAAVTTLALSACESTVNLGDACSRCAEVASGCPQDGSVDVAVGAPKDAPGLDTDSFNETEAIDANDAPDTQGEAPSLDSEVLSDVNASDESDATHPKDSACVEDGAGGSDLQILGCTQRCDDLHSKTCLSAFEHSNCRGLCGCVNVDILLTFLACAVPTTLSSCDTLSPCYDVFAGTH